MGNRVKESKDRHGFKGKEKINTPMVFNENCGAYPRSRMLYNKIGVKYFNKYKVVRI